MGNAQFKLIDNINDEHKVYTVDELEAMGESSDALSRALLMTAAKILDKVPSHLDSQQSQRSVPFSASEESEFALALMSPVPFDIYRRENVWWAVSEAEIKFQPWVFRFAFPKAINMFEGFYNDVNRSTGEVFPKQAFMDQLRRIKSKGYQRRSRDRRHGDDVEEEQQPAPAPAATAADAMEIDRDVPPLQESPPPPTPPPPPQAPPSPRTSQTAPCDQ